MDKIGDAQFRVMCEMWGVDEVLKALKNMGMSATSKQVEHARRKEAEVQERWDNVFREEPKEVEHEDRQV